MINFENVTGGNTQEHNPRWLQIPDHPYSILIIGGSGSGKTNARLILKLYQPNFVFFVCQRSILTKI